jgi:hypothetical protein
MNLLFRKFLVISVLTAFALSLLVYFPTPTIAATPTDYETALKKAADYLVSIQDTNGFWSKTPFGIWEADAENATGNAITALVKAYGLTGVTSYLDSAKKGGDFLISEFIASDGTFDVHRAEIIGGNAYMNHLSPFLTAWIKLYQATGEHKYLNAATAFGNYLLTNGARCTEEMCDNYGLFGYLIRPEDFWSPGYGAFGPGCLFYHGHYLNYGYEQIYGLALLSEITGNPDYLDAAELGAQHEIKYQKADGSFPAEMPDEGTLDIHYGSAKILAYAKLYDITNKSQYSVAIEKYIGWLLIQQNSDYSFGTGDLVRSTTWAAKALLAASRILENEAYKIAGENAVDWLLTSGHGYDPTAGAVARYAESANVYIAYSQTPFIMTMAEFLAASIPPVIEVDIDIEPFSRSNIIILSKWGLISVAILSTENFDAPNEVERTSLTFGRTGSEDSLAFCFWWGLDINRDRHRDLVCYFWTKDTGFDVGDTQGILKGKTKDGMHIWGSDLVKIVKLGRWCWW